MSRRNKGANTVTTHAGKLRDALNRRLHDFPNDLVTERDLARIIVSELGIASEMVEELKSQSFLVDTFEFSELLDRLACSLATLREVAA